MKLQWANVDFDLNIINFTETKTNKDRSVPMEPIVRQALVDLYENAGDAEYVFTNPDTGTRYNDIKKAFSAACREAGITHFTSMTCVIRLVPRLADAGVDVVKIKELMDNHAVHSRHGSRKAWGDWGAVRISTETSSKDGHKMVTKEKRQVLQPAANH